MSQFRDELRNGASLTAKDIMESLGDQGQYVHRSGAPVDIVLLPSSSVTVMVDLLSTRTERLEQTFWIPRQDNFPPQHGITVNDEVLYQGPDDTSVVTWRVVEASNPDSVGALYRLKCQKMKTKVVGGAL
jgi:hypothetical protein